MSRLMIAAVLGLTFVSCNGGDSEPIIPSPPTQLTADSPLADIVDRYVNSPDTYASLHGVVESEAVSRQFQEEVWYEAPDKWRIEMTGDRVDVGSIEAGHTRITNGGDHYLIRERLNQYCHSHEQSVQGSSVADRIDNQIVGLIGQLDLSNAAVVATETIAGRPALKLLIDPDIPRRFVWIDAVYGTVLAYDYDVETSMVPHSAFTSIAFNEDIDDGLFDADLSGYRELPCEEVVNY